MLKRTIAALLILALVLSCVPVMTFAAESTTATLKVDDVYATPGSTVNVDVEIEGNPGILGATLSVSWEDGLTLVDCSNGAAFSELSFQAPSRYTSGCNFVWYGSAISEAVDGAILTLTFQVAETAVDADSYAIEITYDSRDILDESYNSVELNIVNGSVRIVTYKPGDVSGDDRINPLDLVKLCQYISDGCTTDPDGFNVTINESAADVNDDGRMNPLDLILISQYISDGCETRPDGYNVGLKPSTPRCTHVMQKIEETAATCTEPGKKAYWYCTQCQKYFSTEEGTSQIDPDEDTEIEALGHNIVVVPGYDATKTETGLTDGKVCDREGCDHVELAQEVIPIITGYKITYEIANGEDYIDALNLVIPADKLQYYNDEALELPQLDVAGYKFVGWSENQASSENILTEIPVGQTGDKKLYAHWELIPYTISFDSPDYEKESITYTVDKGATLGKDPYIPGYTFVGWSNDDGFIVSSTIPVGTTGHFTLHANWTSNRNKAVSYETYAEPIIITDEADQQIVFVYDIGRIENVPLTQLSETAITVIDGNTVTVNETIKYTDEIGVTEAEDVAHKIANATTRSSGWTLSKEWNDFYSAEEESGTVQIKSEERTDATGKEVGGKYFVSNSEGGSSFVSTESGGSSSNSSKVTTDTSKGINYSYDTTTETYADAKLSAKNETELSAGVSASYGPYKAEAGVKNTTTVAAETSSGRKDTSATHFDGSASSYVGTVDTASSSAYYNVSTNDSSSWNSTTSYENSEKYSVDTEISNAISEQIQKNTSYSIGNSMGETNTQDVRVEGETVNETAYTTNFKYYEGTSTEKSVSKTETLTTAGNYRYVLAGTVHVYGVVGYDIANGTYYTYTYSVLADKTEVWLDFSKETTSFDDCENGVVTFTVPYEVNEYVLSMTAASHGIEFEEGTVNGIELTDKYDGNIVIPQYHAEKDAVSGDYTSYKTTGFNASFLQDTDADSEEVKEMKAYIRSTVETIILPPSVTEIPDNAFQNCTALKNVMAFGVTSIGENAFAGCVNLGRIDEQTVGEFSVDNMVTYVGANAFKDVPAVAVKAANAQVAEEIMSSGAKNIKVDMEYVADGTYDNKLIDIPDTTESFTLIGRGKTFTNLKLISEANATLLSGINFVGNTDTPLDITSSTVTLVAVSVQDAPGFAMMLKAEDTAMYLQGTNTLSSLSANAVISRNVSFAKADAGVTGKLQLTGNYAIYGTKTNSGMVTFNEGQWVELDKVGYDNLLDTITVTFDANGGVIAEEEAIKSVTYQQNYGELPVPTRQYYTFAGWFTEAEGGTQVSADDSVDTLAPQTLYAHWTRDDYTLVFDPNGGSVEETSRVVLCGTAVGDLPLPVRAGYAFNGWFTADDAQVTAETAMEAVGSVTVTAKWTIIPYSVTWNTGTGYTIAVSRTSSPNAGAATGTLNSGDAIYYGDVLSVSYAASTGYTLTNQGKTSITVAGDVTASDIYASAAVNAYNVSWNTGTGYTIAVTRTGSPLAGAPTGALNNDATVYYGDTLSVTYTAWTGYSIKSKGSTTITVTGDITYRIIYATATVNEYTYNIVYRSSNGTDLGGSTATYNYGTTNTITAPAKSGYDTPPSQTIPWDSTSAKTITFTYTPTSVATSQAMSSGWFYKPSSYNYGITYSANAEYRNRTANSVQVRIVWTQTISGAAYGYNQWFYASFWHGDVNRGNTGDVTIATASTWPYYSENGPWHNGSVTAYSNWITVSLTTTNATSVIVNCDWHSAASSGSWGNKTLSIPAY